MDDDILIEKLGLFGSHKVRQPEIRSLFILCARLSRPPYIISRLRVSQVSVDKSGVVVCWNPPRRTLYSIISIDDPLGAELGRYVSSRLAKSNGRGFPLFLKAARSPSWFRNACIRWLGIKQSFFKGCKKVPVCLFFKETF